MNAVTNAVTTDSSVAADQKVIRRDAIVAANAVYYGHVANDLRGGFCPKMNYFTLMNVPPQTSVYGYGAYAGKTYAEILEIVRRHLPASEWDVNLEVGCAVPKKFTCYPEQTRSSVNDGSYYGKFKVANRVNKGCFHQFDPSYYKANKQDNGALPTEWCNEFVTVCTKR